MQLTATSNDITMVLEYLATDALLSFGFLAVCPRDYGIMYLFHDRHARAYTSLRTAR